MVCDQVLPLRGGTPSPSGSAPACLLQLGQSFLSDGLPIRFGRRSRKLEVANCDLKLAHSSLESCVNKPRRRLI